MRVQRRLHRVEARPFAVLAWFLAALTFLPAAVHGHGPVNAIEVETLVVADELSDLFYTTGGYDLGELYLGEAYVEGLGDGVYIHTVLWGDYGVERLGSPWSVLFTLGNADGTVERTLTTSDGATFTSDFDALTFVLEGSDVEVQRAFIAYAGTPWTRGTELTQFAAVSYVGDEARDAAPGGVFVPGSMGLVEAPMGNSEQVAASYPLVGPTKYAKAEVKMTEAGVVLHVASLLKQGDQHIVIDAGSSSLEGELVFELKANEERALPLRAAVGQLDVRTDLGGRVVIDIQSADAGLIAQHEDGTRVVLSQSAPDQEASLNVVGLLVAALVVAVVARRR